MSRSLSSPWRFNSRILVPIVLVVGVTALMVAGLLLYAARASDALARERQAQLVNHALDEAVAKIARDQQSVAIWDETVRKTELGLDVEWLDGNVGVWLHAFFGHDMAFVLDRENQPTYAMVGGARAEPAIYARFRGGIDPLVTALRRMIAADPAAVSAASADLLQTQVIKLGGRPAIVSVVPILSDTGRIAQFPASERLHVSVRFLDGSFLDEAMARWLISDLRFSWAADSTDNEATIPFAVSGGAATGHLIWRPDRPGWLVMMRTAPVLVLALLVVAAVIGWLVRRLRRASAELQASEAQAQHLAFHDPLTGLANRGLFSEELDRALHVSRRTGSRVALLYLDLDRFKNVNDTLGHPAGDDLIRSLAQRLTGLVRGTDCVARIGGDEFAVIQTGVTSLDDVAALCDRILEAVRQPFELLGNQTYVGVSIGVAVAPDAGTDRAEIVRKADIALYCAKSAGRNRSCVFADDMDQSVQRRREIERDLRAALEAGDQFCVHYQPLYGPDACGVVGVEALLRWTHPVHGAIAPAVFIPIAEESGMIQAIGERVLREACTASRRWPTIRKVAVNASAIQFRSPDFAASVLGILQECGMEPNRLELEITEGVLLDATDLSASALKTLRAAGVRIVLDDFGTGYSSLSYLQRYPVDKIKIDRSFVQNLDSAAASGAIVRSMVNLAHAMGMDVTAEGVETAGQRDFLQSIACNEMQGYLLSRPVRAEAIDEILGAATRNPRPVRSAA